MIDKKWIGHELPPSVLPIERSRLQFFAKAIGETDPVYTDTAAARDAGYPDLPAPPTFLFAAELDSGASDQLLAELQIPIAKLLHGEQSFSFHAPACAGDTVTVRSTISDIYDKKNGALDFVVRETRVTNQKGEHVADLRSVLVQRNG
jgi:acyl dehydratase